WKMIRLPSGAKYASPARAKSKVSWRILVRWADSALAQSAAGAGSAASARAANQKDMTACLRVGPGHYRWGDGRRGGRVPTVQPPFGRAAVDRAPPAAEVEGRHPRRPGADLRPVPRRGPRGVHQRDTGGPVPDARPVAARAGVAAVPEVGAQTAAEPADKEHP